MTKEIYLDYAAATPLDPRVKEAMEHFWDSDFGNPSAIHAAGRRVKDAIEEARRSVARVLGARSDEIIFTAGGTEADNVAIFGAAGAFRGEAKHLITSAIEHHAVLRSFEALARDGWEVTYLPVSEYGLVDPESVRRAIRPDTLLVSVMYANNEIGTVQPVAEVGAVIRDARRARQASKNSLPLYFHSDASQAGGFLDLNVQKLGVDLMSLNGGKIYGPKGTATLLVRRGVRLAPILHGGGQEKNLRSGTENVPGIVGFAKALEIAEEMRPTESVRLADLRDHLINRLTSEVPKTILNGHPARRLPNNVNVSVLDIEGEALVLYLDAKGMYASTGSACTSATLEPSHVILALGRPYEYAHGSLRFTLGRSTTRGDLDYVMDVFPAVVEKLRAISPVRVAVHE